MKYYTTSEKKEVQNYPYGYTQRTTATFGVEFKKGKGFRTTFQTVNPRTGKLNAVKCSTYSPVVIMYTNEDGKVGYKHLEFYGDEGFTRNVNFMAEHFDLFTEEQIKYIASYLISNLKADIFARNAYCGTDIDKLLPLYNKAMEAALAIYKDGVNLFSDVKVDFEAANALKVDGFNPFEHCETTLITTLGHRNND